MELNEVFINMFFTSTCFFLFSIFFGVLTALIEEGRDNKFYEAVNIVGGLSMYIMPISLIGWIWS